MKTVTLTQRPRVSEVIAVLERLKVEFGDVEFEVNLTNDCGDNICTATNLAVLADEEGVQLYNNP